MTHTNFLLFRISVKRSFLANEAAANLKRFLHEEKKNCGLQILAFSENPLSATVAIPQDKKHDLRIALNLFSAETAIHWTLETE